MWIFFIEWVCFLSEWCVLLSEIIWFKNLFEVMKNKLENDKESRKS